MQIIHIIVSIQKVIKFFGSYFSISGVKYIVIFQNDEGSRFVGFSYKIDAIVKLAGFATYKIQGSFPNHEVKIARIVWT